MADLGRQVNARRTHGDVDRAFMAVPRCRKKVGGGRRGLELRRQHYQRAHGDRGHRDRNQSQRDARCRRCVAVHVPIL